MATSPLTATGPIQSLADLGITSDKHGLLEIDSEMLEKVIDNNYPYIANLFAKKLALQIQTLKLIH